MPSAGQRGSISMEPAERSSSLPEDVVNCLDNARFLHLATCNNNTPHVSLMNYTYLASTPFADQPTIIMTALPDSRKTQDLSANPKVSVVVHDWVTARPPTVSDNNTSSGSTSSLANLLFGLNSAAMSRISVSLNGQATVLQTGSEEEAWCKQEHKKHNTFDEASGGAAAAQANEDAGQAWMDGQDQKVIVVRITDGRISDYKGQVKDWVLDTGRASAGGELSNGA